MNQESSPEKRRIELSEEESVARMADNIKGKLERKEGIRYASMALMKNHQGEFVLTKRRLPPEPDKFSVVGGKIDQGPFAPKKGGSLTLALALEGFENPTEALTRELTEEVFPKLKGREPEELEKLFNPKRKAVIFDAKYGNFLAVYTVDTPPGAEIETDPREISEVSELSKIKSEEINPLTRFILKLEGKEEMPDDDLITGKMPGIITPGNMLRYEAGIESLKPTVGKSENVYYVEYK